MSFEENSVYFQLKRLTLILPPIVCKNRTNQLSNDYFLSHSYDSNLFHVLDVATHANFPYPMEMVVKSFDGALWGKLQ